LMLAQSNGAGSNNGAANDEARNRRRKHIEAFLVMTCGAPVEL